ncbi:putative alpha-1,6-mannosyltransferase subunit [Talaromyces proteolyticus]|uniref:Alpha-1,6-mannosyltransferase subunit n=1 Tax=Talaromyces proteolyticus TaxID=1131652 RepID=A0AAD4KSA8_9EURO|nr:putative alpha-1,6-mannosyltransferase subunit [Talaromyces proteolyticus]KAH8697678.1 putative alpha-1,6-mannosyltransferase subunit [Talaromyces proteolyticus]
MQYALPPRKSSTAPPFAPRTSLFSLQRRRQLRTIGIIAFTVISVLFFLSRYFRATSGGPITTTILIPSGTPTIVLVTLFDPDTLSEAYLQNIKNNREDYASRHGYANFFANASDYLYTLNEQQPRSWVSVPAVRHAMSEYPYSTYFFFLSAHALIMEPRLSLERHVLEPKQLDSLMMKDQSVVPPDSVIKTFSHLTAKDVELIITQDGADLVPSSFIIKQGEWSRFFLDVWYDPLYRKYNFAKAEKHALDHIVQWHATILAKMALIPQRIINSYSKDSPDPAIGGTYHEGDFVIHFNGCDAKERSCEEEMRPYYSMWQRKTTNLQ